MVARGSDRGSDRGSLAPNGENQAQTRQADAGTSGSSISYVGNCFFCDGCCGRFTTTHTPYTHRRMQTHVHMYTFSIYYTHARTQVQGRDFLEQHLQGALGRCSERRLAQRTLASELSGDLAVFPGQAASFSRKATATAVAVQWRNTRLIRAGPSPLPRACCKPAAAFCKCNPCCKCLTGNRVASEEVVLEAPIRVAVAQKG